MGAFQGKVGTLTTYNAQVGNIARIRYNATNVGESASRTTKQQTNRVRWANLVNFYKASKQWMKKAFEAKKKGISDYNRFMSVNFDNARVALTKSQAAAGACVVEGYLISQGSLSPVEVRPQGDHWITNIVLGDLQLTENTTVAELSAAILANNNFIREGMQLSCISYQQIIDNMGTPRIICTAYEMLIDTKNTVDAAVKYLPEFCLTVEDQSLATSNNISVGAFAYILSETRNGRTSVSTQELITNNDVLLESFTSAEQLQLAIDSYGMSADTFLDSENAQEKGATPQPNYILAARSFDNHLYNINSYVGPLKNFLDPTRSAVSTIVMAHDIAQGDIDRVNLYVGGELKLSTRTVAVKDGRNITLTGASTWTNEYDQTLHIISVEIKGVEYKLRFSDNGGITEID